MESWISLGGIKAHTNIQISAEVQSASNIRTFTKAANKRSIELNIEKPKDKLSFKKFLLETPVTRENNTF